MAKQYITSELIQARLEQMKKFDIATDIAAEKEEYNLIILKTPNGDIRIKTKLTKEEWLKKYELRGKNKTKSKKK